MRGWLHAWLKAGRISEVTEIDPPAFEPLVEDLKELRLEGIVGLCDLQLPSLAQASRAAGTLMTDDPPSPQALEAMLRSGLDQLGGGRLAECAELLFGLAPGTRGDTPTQLRRDAAERWGVSESRFRREPQRIVIEQLAEAILSRCHSEALRRARRNLERRLPTTSRLAVQWLERFEAMYRIWSPASGLAGDITAHASTLLDEDRPYDELDEKSGQLGYTQEHQAAGYGKSALYYYARVLTEVRRFQHRYGGLWLLSDAEAEQEVADAIYRMTWHSPTNERDDSYLRSLLTEVSSDEQHDFLTAVADDRIALAIHDEWLAWLADCDCYWEAGRGSLAEPFPTHRNHAGIDARCQPHCLVAACADYMRLNDAEWAVVADWYRLEPSPRPGVTGETLYQDLVSPLHPWGDGSD